MGGGVHVVWHGGLVAVWHWVVCRLVMLLEVPCVGQRYRRHWVGHMSVVGMHSRSMCRWHRSRRWCGHCRSTSGRASGCGEGSVCAKGWAGAAS